MKDGNYGAENPDVKGGWDGMVGELIRKVSTYTQTKMCSFIKYIFLLSIRLGMFDI